MMSYGYCQSSIEGGKKCKIQCEHCKVYYKPLERNLLIDKLNYCEYVKEWLRQNENEPLPDQRGFKIYRYNLWIERKHIEFRKIKGIEFLPNNKKNLEKYNSDFMKWLSSYALL